MRQERSPDTKRLRVLYIDDDAVNLKVVADMLGAVDAEVTCLKSPVEALALMAQSPFDVALIDIHMPEMSGIALLAALRGAIGPNRATPALALTADLTRDETQYRELGFDGFIAKPVLLKPLLSRILGVLEAAALARAADPRTSRAG